MSLRMKLHRVQNFVQAVHARSEERIILNPLDETRPHRILDNVPGDAQRRVVAAQSSLKSVTLPQSETEDFSEVKRRKLFRSRNEPAAIRIRRLSLHEKMNVVWHKAVRKNCESFVNRCAQELPVDGVGTFVSQEDAATFECAERKEISMRAKVIEGLEMFRLAGDHIGRRASRMPRS